MNRSEEAFADDVDGVRCNACGSVLCVEEPRYGADGDSAPKQVAVPPRRPVASTKRKVSPKMLRYHATRAATRVAMLAAIPGVDTARAAAILCAYPTFRELMAAKHSPLAGLVVRKSPPRRGAGGRTPSSAALRGQGMGRGEGGPAWKREVVYGRVSDEHLPLPN